MFGIDKSYNFICTATAKHRRFLYPLIKIDKKKIPNLLVLKIIPYICDIKHNDYARGIQIFRIFIFLL